MSHDPMLEPLSEDIARALQAERSRPDLPAVTQSHLSARIEASDEYLAVTAKRPTTAVPQGAFAALRTRTGLALFLAGALWGAAVGGAVVALMRPPPQQAATAPAPLPR